MKVLYDDDDFPISLYQYFRFYDIQDVSYNEIPLYVNFDYVNFK